MKPCDFFHERNSMELASIKAIPYIPKQSVYRKSILLLNEGTIPLVQYVKLRERLKKFYRTNDLSTVI